MLYVTRDEIELYLQRLGKRGEKTLSTLGKLQPFAQCLKSELGFELLKELAGRYEELLDKVSELTATDEEKVEFKVTKHLLITFANKISQYNQHIGEIKEKTKGPA